MEHADQLRRKIAAYYQYLTHVRGQRAVVYQREITRLTSELEQIESKDPEQKNAIVIAHGLRDRP